MFNTQQESFDEQQEPEVNLHKGQFRQQTLRQYYRYLNLLKKTNNFCKDFDVYKNLNDNDFEDLTLVGWMFQVQTLKIKLEGGGQQQCMAPVVYSNIKDPFKNYQQTGCKAQSNTGHNISQTSQTTKRSLGERSASTSQTLKSQVLEPHVRRSLLLGKTNYTKYYLKAFNQVLKQSKQFKKSFVVNSGNGNYLAQIQWVYAFTGLRLSIQGGKLYFVMTEQTKIIAIDIKFYMQTIQPLQKSVGFPYSYVCLSQPPSNYHQQSVQQGYSLNLLQTQSSILDKLSFTGILKQCTLSLPPEKTCRQIILTFLQDGPIPRRQMLGLAKVIIKLPEQSDQQHVTSYFKIGFVYLVTNVELSISSMINISYKLKYRWQEHLFQLGIQKVVEVNGVVVDRLPVVRMDWFKMANANRNIVKLRVEYLRCEHFFGKVICAKCKYSLTSDGYCSRFCGQNDGELVLWAILLVSDDTSYAQLSLQTKQTLQFFNFSHENIQEIRNFVIAQNSRKMVKLYSQFNYYSGRSSSQPLLNFQKIIAAKLIKKTLLGIARHNINQSFTQQLTEQQKIQFQQSLQTTKEFMRKNKVFFNGYFKKIDRNLKKAVPFIKVIEILNQ